MRSVEKRITDLELEGLVERSGLGTGTACQGGRTVCSDINGDDKSFAQLLREARERTARGEPAARGPITRKMLDDPVEGEFWRQMKEARERVRLLAGEDGSWSEHGETGRNLVPSITGFSRKGQGMEKSEQEEEEIDG